MVQRYHKSVSDVFIKDGVVSLVRDGVVLARFRLVYDSDSAVKIKDWKALQKGKGYGKELLVKFVKSRPDLFFITTDGFTSSGLFNIKKALPDWKLIDYRRGYTDSVGVLMRQDAIDYYIDNHKGRFGLFHLDSSLHSREDKRK